MRIRTLVALVLLTVLLGWSIVACQTREVDNVTTDTATDTSDFILDTNDIIYSLLEETR